MRARRIWALAIVGVCAGCAAVPQPPSDSPPITSDVAGAVAAVRTDDAWPGPTREEPPGAGAVVPWQSSGEQLTFTDAIGDAELAGAAKVDLSNIEVQRISATSDGRGVSLRFNVLVGGAEFDSEDTMVKAFGVVLDVDGDAIPDYRMGMDNVDGDVHREWISDLATGEARINPGPTYGWRAFGHFTDTYFPGHEEPSSEGQLIATLGAPGTRFYVWATVIDEDGHGVTDYAPDAGWLLHNPGSWE